MTWRNRPDGYGRVTRILHWTTAALVIGLVALGWYMVDLSYFDRWYNVTLRWHRALGMLVLALALVTLGWRTVSPSPQPVAGTRPWEHLAGRCMHILLLSMIVLVPVSGYLISTSAGKSIDILGWFSIPPVIEVDADLRDRAIDVHYYLAYLTAALVAMHAGAALKHQFINRDGTLERMIRG